MSLLKPLETTSCKIGMRVQDQNGNRGTVKWVGKLEKNPAPPADQPKGVTYAGVVFDDAKPNSPWRCDGTLHGVKLLDGAGPGSVAFLQPKKELWEECIEKSLAAMREQFKERIAHWHDVEVTKFLIARKFDLKLASEMIENHIKWQAEHGVKHTEYFPPRMAVGYPVGMQPDKYDFEGNIIRVERPGNGGKVAPKDFFTEHGMALLMRWHIASMEQSRERMKQSGWKLQRMTFIIDLKDFGSVSTDVARFGQGEGKIDQDHYPEMMARCFMINAPWFFTGLWKVVRLFVDERTKDKIKILGDDYKAELLKYMDESALPSCAGGKSDGWLESTNGGCVGSLTPPAGGAATAVVATAAAAAAASSSSASATGAAGKADEVAVVAEFNDLELALEKERDAAIKAEEEYERRKEEEAKRAASADSITGSSSEPASPSMGNGAAAKNADDSREASLEKKE